MCHTWSTISLLPLSLSLLLTMNKSLNPSHLLLYTMMDGASPAMETEKSETPMPSEARRRGVLPLPRAEPPAYIGKHRLAASITHLQNQINIIQEELEELETIGESSLVCKELIASIESVPDPLLPVTKGPANVGWERWFLGDDHARRNKRWI